MNNSNETSIFSKAFDPFLQVGITFCAILIGIFGGMICRVTGILEISDTYEWMVTASFMLCFGLFNSVLSLASKDINRYWSRSMIGFGLMVILASLLAYFSSGISLFEAGSFTWIFQVVIVGYLVFVSIIGFMKRIVEFAQREEWNKPKRHSKKRKL